MLVADRVDVPIATGERLLTLEEFGMLLREMRPYIRPDVVAGGALLIQEDSSGSGGECGKWCHNPLSPVSTAACISWQRPYQFACRVPDW